MRRVYFVLITGLLFWVGFPASGQKQANIWYFGSRAGLDFNNNNPVPLSNGLMNTNEGCATVSDSLGNLLFYTNGVTVWTRNHKLMPNGFRLMGHTSSTQSAVIVPKPGNPQYYYIFTTDLQSQAYGMRYSLIDLAMNKGYGDLSQKNVFMISPVAEKLTAVKHRNNRDVWVITHKWNSDAFAAFLISDKGVSKTPVITNIGTVYKGKSNAAIGCIKASPDGKKLAAAIWRDFNRFEVFDFDNATGKLTNRLVFEPFPEAYGVEFSPDGTKLYGSTSGIGLPAQLWQFNLSLSSKSAVLSSGIQMQTLPNVKFGALQLGPDGKIYLAKEDEKYLGVIRNPNAPGWSCQYIDQGQSLGDQRAKLGLPNFIQSYFYNFIPKPEVAK